MKNAEYTKQKELEFKKYTDKIKMPSKDFEKFLNDYFTGNPMIRGRLEEDVSVWDRLKGEELKVAKQMVLDNLGHDSAYIRAIGIFRDERGVPLLKNLVDTLDNRFCYEKLNAAKVLYDWTGYKPYLELLKMLLPQGGSYTKTSLDYWLNGIEKDVAIHYIFLMLRDEDGFVRWCAYGTLKRYFNLGEQKYDETKYYTAEDVYGNKKLLEQRLNELRTKISDY